MVLVTMVPSNMSQILTGLQPFHDLTYCQLMYTVTSGGLLKKPDAAESLGFSEELWELLGLCWSESSSVRPTAERLLGQLSRASLTWVPPPSCLITGSDIHLDISSPLDIPSTNSVKDV